MNASSIFRVLAAGLVAGLATLGVTSPAQAATTSNVTVTSTGALTAGQPNSAPIVVTFTAPTAMAGNSNNSSQVRLMGATWVTAPTNYQCGSIVSVSADQGINPNCVPSGSSDVYAQGFASNANNWPANVTWTFTFAANSVILPNAPSLNVVTGTFVAAQPVAQYDNGSNPVALTGYVAPASTVIFNANGGSGAMAVQSASTATNLSTNAFTRSGYTFTGWNTAADGTGTAYADGASYPFGSSTTLYAQWTSVLAKTGTDSSGYLVSSAVLLAFGAGLVVLRALSRKKALNS
ncbi:InlB B-repeat-containing protein [Aurantimicrobium minutum]|uniref:Uncharacterized protein n=1 Tax=Aurantimicrobium minutum TaxID=708131 RepID=A0A173LXV3_9MICO|nr:InlB B-repeat-containing protein [Aurantimicrobium minutum]BAU99785.1 Uncharacterized protein AUMI_112430 [Aurantimicrobium minutum]